MILEIDSFDAKLFMYSTSKSHPSMVIKVIARFQLNWSLCDYVMLEIVPNCSDPDREKLLVSSRSRLRSFNDIIS